jgi:hypothetical protein
MRLRGKRSVRRVCESVRELLLASQQGPFLRADFMQPLERVERRFRIIDGNRIVGSPISAPWWWRRTRRTSSPSSSPKSRQMDEGDQVRGHRARVICFRRSMTFRSAKCTNAVAASGAAGMAGGRTSI